MKRFSPIAAFAVLALALTLPLDAQETCTDSPENPTVVLGVVGVTGALLAQLRNRMKNR